LSLQTSATRALALLFSVMLVTAAVACSSDGGDAVGIGEVAPEAATQTTRSGDAASAADRDEAGAVGEAAVGDGESGPDYVLDPTLVSLDVSTVAPGEVATCVAKPAVEVVADDAESFEGIPAHVLCSWSASPPASLPPGDLTPQLLVIPVGQYMVDYSTTGLPTIEQQVALHTMLAIEQPADPGAAVPLLPPAGTTGPALAVQPRFMSPTGVSGLRYVAHVGGPPMQGLAGAGSSDAPSSLFYTFQGMTADGEQWIALFHPVRAEATAEQIAELTSLEGDFTAYINQAATVLARLDPDAAFSPSLAALDEVVSSLQIAAP